MRSRTSSSTSDEMPLAIRPLGAVSRAGLLIRMLPSSSSVISAFACREQLLGGRSRDAYDGHRDLLKLRKGRTRPMRIAYAVHRDARLS